MCLLSKINWPYLYGFISELGRTFSMTMNSSGENEHSFFVSDLSGKGCHVYHWVWCLLWVFYWKLIILRKLSLIPNLLNVFIECWVFSNVFYALINMVMWFLLLSLLILWIILVTFIIYIFSIDNITDIPHFPSFYFLHPAPIPVQAFTKL